MNISILNIGHILFIPQPSKRLNIFFFTHPVWCEFNKNQKYCNSPFTSYMIFGRVWIKFGLLTKDCFSVEYRSHTFYSTAHQTPEHFFFTHPVWCEFNKNQKYCNSPFTSYMIFGRVWIKFGLLTKDCFSVEYRSHAFYSTAHQTPEHFFFDSPGMVRI